MYLRNNPFGNVEAVVESLKTLPQLRELSVNIRTGADAQMVISALEKLEVLNGERIEGSDEEDNVKETQAKSLTDSSLDELAEAAKIYDLIRLVKKSEGGDEEDLFKFFEAQMVVVVKELRNKLAIGLPNDIKKAMILKAKHVLVNTAFSTMIDGFSQDKNIANIWTQISRMYSEIFESLVALLVNAFSQEPDAGSKTKEKVKEKLHRESSREIQSTRRESEEKDRIIAELASKLKEAEESYKELVDSLTASQRQFETLKAAAHKQIEEFKEAEKDRLESLNGTIECLSAQVKTEQTEKNHLHKQTDELLMQMASLEEENKKYLEMIIRHSKEIGSNSSSFASPDFSEQGHLSVVTDNSSSLVKKKGGELGKTPLPLKKLKEIMEDIYAEKAKADERYMRQRQPKMTLENYMYAYLNEKHGSKHQSIKWAELLVKAIKMHSRADSDVALFGKILQNSCDEDYRLVHLEVKATIVNMLAAELKKKNPSKSDEALLKMFREIQKGVIEGWAWKEIIKRMYNEEDTRELIARIEEKALDTRSGRLLFADFTKVPPRNP